MFSEDGRAGPPAAAPIRTGQGADTAAGEGRGAGRCGRRATTSPMRSATKGATSARGIAWNRALDDLARSHPPVEDRVAANHRIVTFR